MSLFGALTTAVSGLTAQSAAFGNISDNVANSQTVGYKEVDTEFIDYLTSSTSQQNNPGDVATRPDYTNNVQGTITQSSNPLAIAISGQGFFAVSEPDGVSANSSTPSFSPQTYYTRAGDFQLDKNGYLVNSAGEYLQGWPVDPKTGAANQSQLSLIQVSQSQFSPIPTTTVDVAANLPAGAQPGSNPSSQIQVYDAAGGQHTLTLTWSAPTAPATAWSLAVTDESGTSVGTATVDFGTNGMPAGTVSSVNGNAGTAGNPATLSLTPGWAGSPITLNLGDYGQANGVTAFAANSYNLRNITQNGVQPGSLSGISINNTGEVIAKYDNGQSQAIAQVPIITFADPTALQRQNGQAFTATVGSGTPIAQAANTNGAGNLVTGSVESSNVDIATEFSKLIVAQQAYSANAKLITTADTLLQTTINMKT